MSYIEERAKSILNEVKQLEINQQATIRQKEKLEKEILEYGRAMGKASENLDIVGNAISILRTISDESVQNSYRFIEQSLNSALERVFENNSKRIRISEYTKGGQYPQLELELIVNGDTVCNLKEESGHGVTQVVSLLCTLSLIVMTGTRRILVMDEILSGLSGKARRAIEDVMWAFSEIGFQFIISEHGFVPKGSKVYKLQNVAGETGIVDEYIEENGIYLDGVGIQRENAYAGTNQVD